MSIPLIVDASAALSWLLESQATPAADALIQELKSAERPMLAPSCFRWEVRHLLVKFERRKAIQPNAADSELATLESDMEIELDSDEFTLLARFAGIKVLATRAGLSMYDAAYLELAMRRDGELASRDGRLLEVAAKLGCAARDLR